MKVDITDIVSNENKSVTKEVEIDLTSFDSKLGNFPIIRENAIRRYSLSLMRKISTC